VIGAAENAGHDPYEDVYDPAAPAPAPPAAGPGGYYPPNTGFPPPPGGMPNQYAAQPQYVAPGGQYAPPPNPAGYNPAPFPPPPPGNVPPQGPPANYNEAFASGANMDPYAARARGADENVSAAPSNGINPFPDQQFVPPYGMWLYFWGALQTEADMVLAGLGSTGGPPPPSVAVHPPAPTPPPPGASYNSSYVPPAERSPSPLEDPSNSRSESTSRRKSVKFTDGLAKNRDTLEVAAEALAKAAE
jgi:hypothetical protein